MRILAMICLVMLAMSGCSDGVDWSEREIRNGELVIASLHAVSAAAEVANAAGTAPATATQQVELLGHLRRAHLLASQVDTVVMQKLHPRMFSKFRLEYQRALAGMIKAYERGDPDAAERAAADIQDFLQWYRANRHTFRWWDESMQR